MDPNAANWPAAHRAPRQAGGPLLRADPLPGRRTLAFLLGTQVTLAPFLVQSVSGRKECISKTAWVEKGPLFRALDGDLPAGLVSKTSNKTLSLWSGAQPALWHSFVRLESTNSSEN